MFKGKPKNIIRVALVQKHRGFPLFTSQFDTAQLQLVKLSLFFLCCYIGVQWAKSHTSSKSLENLISCCNQMKMDKDF